MKRKGNFLKRSRFNEKLIEKDIEQAKDMIYWFSERF